MLVTAGSGGVVGGVILPAETSPQQAEDAESYWHSNKLKSMS